MRDPRDTLPSPAALAELIEKAVKGPWRCDDDAWKIWAPSAKGGEVFIFDVRGWGYLTGGGSGALGLPAQEAGEIQKANGDLAALAPSLARAHLLLQAREARLVAALESVTELYCDLVNSGDCGFWDPETVDEVKTARTALKESPNG